LFKLRTQDALESKKILQEAKELIDSAGYVNNVVNATYYKAQAEYFKVVDDPNEFYRNALLFLAYTPIENIQLRERQAMAYDLGMAALLGDQIYNFGELLAHPIVESLNGTEAEWLVKLLFAFNKGRIEEYTRVNQTYQQQIENLPVLKQRRSFLEEKMRLMAILELVFSRPADNRNIPFVDVSQTTGTQPDFVEPLLLKALAYDLIKGKIDEVEQSIHVTWVQPRVLDKDQILQLKEKIGSWLSKVDSTLAYLQHHGSDELTTTA
jgi:26S proteasome regulatory subunit N9